MNLDEAIKNRRSVRSFKSEPIPPEKIEKIIEAGHWAPSAGNKQPLEIVKIEKEKNLEKLAKAANDQNFIKEAPISLVVCANVPRTSNTYGKRGKRMYIYQDTAAAIQNMLLKAYSLGYGSCWVGSFKDLEVKELINAPDSVKPVAIIPLGKPAEKPETPSRRKIEEFTHKEEYSE